MWKENICSKKYDYEYLLILKEELKKAREKEDYHSLIHIIRSNAVRDLVINLCFLFYIEMKGTKLLKIIIKKKLCILIMISDIISHPPLQTHLN